MDDSFKTNTEAEEHEKIPIKEGNYNFIVLKKDSNKEHAFFMKKDDVTYGHERMYAFSCVRNLDENMYDVENAKVAKPCYNSSYSVSNIEEEIFKENLIPLSQEELNKINDLITLEKLYIPFLVENKIKGRNIFKTL